MWVVVNVGNEMTVWGFLVSDLNNVTYTYYISTKLPPSKMHRQGNV